MTPDFIKQMPAWFLDTIQEATIKDIKIFWDWGISYPLAHLWIIIGILLIVLVYAVFRAFMWHWWVLGSVLYNYLYWGSLLIIGLIFGPEIFASSYVDVGLFILYILCYIIVGKILKTTGIRKL
jgi:hypothetical protein